MPAEFEQWRHEVTAVQGVDLQDWWDSGFEAVSRAKTKEALAQLGSDLRAWVRRGHDASSTVGNVGRWHPHFVGRLDELDQVKRATRGPTSLGVIAVINGLGGIGKTQLALQFAHAYRAQYPGGVWLVQAVGYWDLREAAAGLVGDPAFGFRPSPEAAADPLLAGQEVLTEVTRRAVADGGALLIFDNVDDPRLLGDGQTRHLRQVEDLDYVATTRLGEDELAGPSLEFVTVGPLPHGPALELLREYQPVDPETGFPDFADQAERDAAGRIVGLLDGFTLALEQVAVFMGKPSAPVVPTVMERLLIERGVESTDMAAAKLIGSEIRHQDGLLSAVLRTTLQGLPDAAGTALRVAALLPPDVVPWTWLEAVTTALHPEIADPDPFGDAFSWQEIRTILQTRRLVTGDQSASPTGRIHRLIAAHLLTDVPEVVEEQMTRHVFECVRRMAPAHNPSVWEMAAILEYLEHSKDRHPTLVLRVLGHNSDLYWVAGRWLATPLSLQFAHQALMIGRSLVQQQPDDLQAQRNVAILLGGVARLAVLRDAERALALSNESLAISRSLAQQQPENLQAQQDFSLSLEILAQSEELSDPAAALKLFRESLTISRFLAEQQPESLRAQGDIAISLDNVARLEELRDPASALELFGDSLKIRRFLAEQQPESLQAQRDIAVSLNFVAFLEQRRDPVSALELFRDSLAIRRFLAEQEPGNLDGQRDVAASLDSMAFLEQRHDPTSALELFRESLAIRRFLAQQMPESLQTQRDIAVLLSFVARLEQPHDPASAQELFKESLAISRSLAQQQPESLQAQRDVSVSLDDVARLEQRHDPASALELFKDSLKIRRFLGQQQPGNLEAQRDISVSLDCVARLEQHRDPDAAQVLFRELLGNSRFLAQQQPEDLDVQRDLMFSLVYMLQRQAHDEALKGAQEAVAIAQGLFATRKDAQSATELVKVLHVTAEVVAAVDPHLSAQWSQEAEQLGRTLSGDK